MDESSNQLRGTGLYGQRRSRCSDAVQVVNFYNPWTVSTNPGESSIQSAAACRHAPPAG